MEKFHTMLSDLTLQYESEIKLCSHTAPPQLRQIACVCDSLWSIEFWTKVYLIFSETFQEFASETTAFKTNVKPWEL